MEKCFLEVLVLNELFLFEHDCVTKLFFLYLR